MLKPQPSNTQVLEAIALTGQHFTQCGGCGAIAASPNEDVVIALTDAHVCPASTLDVIADRVISFGGLLSLLAVTTAAFVLWRLTYVL